MAKKEDLMTSKIACELLRLKEGDKIPTMPSLVKKYGVGFGTVDKALTNLKSTGVVELQSKGQVGTYLIKKDFKKLSLLSDSGPFVAQIPLPNAIEYEGLATGLTCAFKAAGLPFSLTFKNGAKSRLENLKNGRCDFTVVSGNSAKCIDKEEFKVLRKLEQNTYYSSLYVLRRKDAGDRNSWTVGVDSSSYDNIIFTNCEFPENEKKEFPYYNLPYAVANGSIDAAVIHSRSLLAVDYVDYLNMGAILLEPLTHIEALKEDASYASFVALKANSVVTELFEEVLDVKIINDVVRQIINRETVPSF